jgi:hypothetical protein
VKAALPPAAVAPKATTTKKQNKNDDKKNEFHLFLQKGAATRPSICETPTNLP